MAFFRKFPRRKTYSRRLYRKKTVIGRYRRKFQTRVKRALLKTSETKYLESASENIALYHDRGATGAGALTTNQGALIFNPWWSIIKGTGVSSRIGDEIYPTGMGVRILLKNEANRPNLHYRIIVAVIPKIYNGSVMDGTNYDLGSGTSGNDILTNYLKKEGVKVLYDKVIHCQDQTAGVYGGANQNYVRFLKMYIRSKRGQKITWMEDGLLANKPVGVWVIPYEYYGTLRTDLVARASYSFKLYWKDV